jgi:hypothetical protein
MVLNQLQGGWQGPFGTLILARSFWHFDSTLEKGLKNAAHQSVAIMNVKLILAVEENERSVTTVMMGMEGRLCSFGKCQANVRAPGHENQGNNSWLLTVDRHGDIGQV